MQLLLRHHFSDSPARKKVALGLYSRGISVKNGKLYSNSIEISPSQVARALKVNRRTVYDTIRKIQEDPELSTVMSNIYPEVSFVNVAPMIGSQVIIIYTSKGCYQKVFNDLFDRLKGYHSYVKEVVSRTLDRNQGYIRLILQIAVPENIINGLEEVKGITRVVVVNPEPGAENALCGTCRAFLFPGQMASPLKTEVEPLKVNLQTNASRDLELSRE